MLRVNPPESAIHRSPLIALVPELYTYSPNTGIGRVLHSLNTAWGDQVYLVSTELMSLNLPLLRNFPYGVKIPNKGNIVLLPRLTGAQALRNTSQLPSVVIVHDIGVVDFPGDRLSIDWFTHQSAIQNFYGLRYASMIISDSIFTKQRLLHYLPELADRVSVVHAGVSDTFLSYTGSQTNARNQIEQALQISLRSPLLIYVGSELPRKNIGLLLRTFAELRRQYPDAQLLKVGGPGHPRWRKETIRTMHQLGLHGGHDVVFLEGIDDELLADAYRAADVFVSTSLYEGFGLPALEAMAVGTPVVVTNRGSFPEIVGNAGWVVQPNISDFVFALENILCANIKSKQSPEVTDFISQFTWANAANKYIQIIRSQLLGSN